MDADYQEFEKPIVEMEEQIRALEEASAKGEDVTVDLKASRNKHLELIADIFSGLTTWQKIQLARHAKRPHTTDIIDLVFDDFIELHGDRRFADDAAIVGGLARLNSTAVMVIGHEKGRGLEDKSMRRFGLPNPEGLRKAHRLMLLADRFRLPLFTLVDTAGAYPGTEGEERNQNEAIATNLLTLSRLQVPIITTVIGEGGSGGALAIGFGDNILMLQYSTYSVATPEACASIIWRSVEHAEEAAEAMRMLPKALLELGAIDEIVPEPPGGAHRDYTAAADMLRERLIAALDRLQALSVEELLAGREQRIRLLGD